MKIARIGAPGFIGSRIVAELTSRGHDVTGIALVGEIEKPAHSRQCSTVGY